MNDFNCVPVLPEARKQELLNFVNILFHGSGFPPFLVAINYVVNFLQEFSNHHFPIAGIFRDRDSREKSENALGRRHHETRFP